MTSAAVANFATYIHDQDGTTLPPGMTPKSWALQRFFYSGTYFNHPEAQDVNAWASQFIMLLKGVRRLGRRSRTASRGTTSGRRNDRRNDYDK